MYFTGMYLQYHFPRAVQVILSSQLINLIGRSLSYAVTMCTAATEEGSKQDEIELLQPVPQSGQRCNIPWPYIQPPVKSNLWDTVFCDHIYP